MLQECFRTGWKRIGRSVQKVGNHQYSRAPDNQWLREGVGSEREGSGSYEFEKPLRE